MSNHSRQGQSKPQKQTNQSTSQPIETSVAQELTPPASNTPIDSSPPNQPQKHAAIIEPALVPWYRQPITAATVVMAAAGIVNLFVSIGLWHENGRTADLAQKAFEASARPYVGSFISSSDDPTNHRMGIRAVIKNYGTVPANNFKAEWNATVNGNAVPGIKIPDNPSTLFPGQTVAMVAQISGKPYDELTAGNQTLIATVLIRYQGVSSENGKENKDYTYCNREQYDSEIGAFVDLGRCNAQNPPAK